MVMHEHVSNNCYFHSAKEFQQKIHQFFHKTFPEIATSLVDRINDNFHIVQPASWTALGILENFTSESENIDQVAEFILLSLALNQSPAVQPYHLEEAYNEARKKLNILRNLPFDAFIKIIELNKKDYLEVEKNRAHFKPNDITKCSILNFAPSPLA